MEQENADRQTVIRTIVLFVVITFVLTSVFVAGVINLGAMEDLYIMAVMWMPAVGAFLTCRIQGRPISSLPWRWGEWRWNVYAWLLPLTVGLIAYITIWSVGLGGFPNIETVDDWATRFGLMGAPGFVVIGVGFVLFGVVGTLESLGNALGEEIGWRGFLIWELRKLMPFWAVGVVSGIIWGVWHLPAILGTDYNAGTDDMIFQVAMFFANVIGASVIFAYFTFRAQSLWPAAILHASHNLFIQAVYSPLTVFGPETHRWVGEFGIALPVLYGLLAVYFVRRAAREGL